MMNSKHAIGFMMLGAVFGLLPALVPGWCPPTGVDGTSTRALWLELMSAVLITIAMIHFGRRILSSLAALLETAPAAVEPAFETAVPRDAIETAIAAHELVPARRRRPRGLLPLPVALDASALLEQRRAA